MKHGSWKRSSRCESHQCVEVLRAERAVYMRNTGDVGSVLTFSLDAWRRFAGQLRSEELAR